MTLLQITNTIKSISLAQPNIHSFVDEFIDLNSSDAKYSAIILQQITHRRNNDFISYSFYLGYADRLNEDKSNEIEVQSTAIQVIDNIVYALENHNLDTSMGAYNTFTQRFLAEAAGAYVELNITVPVGECTDDFSKEELNVNIVANGEYNYIPTGLGFSSVHLNVDVAKLQDKALNITKNGQYNVRFDKGYSGLGNVDVNVDVDTQSYYDQGYSAGKTEGKAEGIQQQKSKLVDLEITENNTEYSREDGYKNVSVNIDETPIYDRGYDKGKEEGYNTGFVKGTDYGYDRGYDKGKEEGTDEQKSKLTDISITSNGTYTRDDGYKSVVVNVPSSGGDGIDFSVIGYDTQENTDANTEIQDWIGYSQSLLESYTDNTRYFRDKNLIFAPLFPCDNRTSFNSMFSLCGYLMYIPKLNTANGTNFVSMFNGCSSLTNIPLINTANGTDFCSMFYGCSSLTNIPLINTANGTDFCSMFYGCSSLTTIPALDMSKGLYFAGMFSGCSSLTTIPALDMPQVLQTAYMFGDCSSLTTIKKIEISGVDNEGMFSGCSSLTDINLSGLINYDISFEDCINISYNSIISILTACSRTTDYRQGKNVSFNRTIADQNNELTNLVVSCTEKGWTVSGLTISA